MTSVLLSLLAVVCVLLLSVACAQSAGHPAHNGVVAPRPGDIHLRNCSAFVPPRETDNSDPRVVCVPASAYKQRLSHHQKRGWKAIAIGVDSTLQRVAQLGSLEMPFPRHQCWNIQKAAAQHAAAAAVAYVNITIDLTHSLHVSGIRVARCVGAQPITQHWLDVSVDGVQWSDTLAWGMWTDDTSAGHSTAEFYPVHARYVRLRATLHSNVSMSDLHVLVHPDHHNLTRTTSSATGGGRRLLATPANRDMGTWSGTINLPLIPVAAAQLPRGQLLFWSAYSNVAFMTGGPGYTQTATLNLSTLTSTARAISYTAHEMFCPGSAMLSDGRLLVMGGSNDAATSIYRYDSATWTQGRPINIPRSYQSAVTLSDGRVFMIGGSFLGGLGGKSGEVWSPVNGTWTTLSGCPADPIYTADPAGVWRSDNHAWLFARSNGWVLHAGPSKQMNWYNTAGQGQQFSAGLRGDSADAMNGNAVMYDAVQGLILTLGGATAYDQAYGTFMATARSYIVNIGSGVNTRPTVTRSGDLNYARSMSNSVVLPDGSVLVVGGQSQPQPFSDYLAVYAAEVWSPLTGQWTTLASAAIPRTYHSIAVLLADGTVFSGGGGLCGDCATNHLDAQIFSPPYLFNSDGSRRIRPVILSSPATATPGSAITVTTALAVAAFSLIRFESTTHTQHTDQRRIPLQISATASPTCGQVGYSLQIPADTGVLIPGFYYLFALDFAGTPSVAAEINIAPPAAVVPVTRTTGPIKWNGNNYCLDWIGLGANGNRWVGGWPSEITAHHSTSNIPCSLNDMI